MANTSNASTLTTDFNVTPYYDDYDSSKNFYRILFKPGYAVQARELTQLQSILQNQISSFGKHVFVEGSIVLPGRFDINTNVDYVKVRDVDQNSNPVTISNYNGKVVTGQTSGLKATIFLVEDGSESSTNTKTIFVSYNNSDASTGTVKTFSNGEVLLTDDATPLSLITLSSSATGKGSVFTITQGVFFAKNHFISFPTQTVVLERYSTNPSCQVGFMISEDIINYIQDQSLLDPALEASNYSAPGADRFKLTPTLSRLDYGASVGPPDYVALFSIKEGVVQTLFEKSQYSILLDTLAKRTSDESGDYYVNGMDVTIRENLDTGNNYGYSTTGSSSLLSIGIEAGEGYVKGYPVGKLVPTWITTPKANTYQNVNSQITASSEGNYINIKEVVGDLSHDFGTQVGLYDTIQGRISNGTFSGAQTGNQIGTARVKHLIYNSGTPGTALGSYKLYLFDIQMTGSNSFSSVKSVYLDNASTADFGADVISDLGGITMLNDSTKTLLYYTGSSSTRKIRSTDDLTVDTSFYFKTGSSYTAASNGFFSIPITGGAGEIFPYGTGATLDSTQKTEIIVTLNEAFNISMSGTVTGVASGTTVNGSGTSFTRLNLGDKIQFSGNTSLYTVATIANNTTLTVDKTLPGVFSGNSIFKVYKIGDIINLNGVGVDAGATRTVTQGASTLNIDLKETLGATRSVSASYVVARTSAKEIAKTLRPNVFVKISCAVSGTTGPFNLGFADVYKIRQIRKDSSVFTTSSQGTNVTQYFTFDNGQRDELYDHAKITPVGVTLTSSDYLLVELDYFYHDTSAGVGYFSIDSYPINDSAVSSTSIMTQDIPIYRSSISGAQYDLRNYLDFRPAKAATATYSTTVAGASSDPAASSGFSYIASGLRLVAPSKQIQYDYSYYVPRRDLVVVDKDNNFFVVKGIPSVGPITPVAPDNTMSLASLYITPYPSLAPIYGKSIGRSDLACGIAKTAIVRQTMRDIGIIKQRVENLEYYVSLNTLEKSAIDLKVMDSNGLDRFKNGIFVDTFNDHSLGATYNPDYSIVVDKQEKSIRTVYTMDSIPYKILSNTNAVISKTGDLITLPYTEEAFITQSYATTFRNMETNVYKYIGLINLSPDQDFWVDTTFPPEGRTNDALISANNYDGGPLTTDWNSWQKSITGYNIYGPAGKLLATVSDTGVVNDLVGNSWWQTWQNFNWGIDTVAQVYAQVYGSATLETNEKYDRTGTNYYLQTNEQKTDLGSRVVDVKLQPYIRPQEIQIYAAGLKPNTRFYTFFDGANMSNYVYYLKTSTNDAYTANSRLSYSYTTNQYDFDGSTTQIMLPTVTRSNTGAPLISSANGEISATLVIPAAAGAPRFKVGTKEVVLTDSPTNEDDATSYARTSFTSQGLIQQKQDTILTTRQTFRAQREVEDTKTGITNRQFFAIRRSSSCMAYSFIPKAPDGEEGLFITGVDLYIASKSDTLGFWVEIREMGPEGGITKNAIPFSDTYFLPNEITTSDDASTPHRVTFRAPIFLYNNTQYALVMHPMGQNPDMYFWVSNLGDTDVTTGKKVTSRSQTGTLYMTNNDTNWDIVPNVDLKVTFYRAVFDTAVTGTVVIGNYPIEIFSLANVSSEFTNYGEFIATADRLTLSGITPSGSSIYAGDLIVGANGANGAVISNTGTTYIVANSRYVVGESVTIRYASNGAPTGVTANIASIADRGSGVLRNYKATTTNNTMIVYGSNGKYGLTNTIIGLTSWKTANVTSIANLDYSTVDFEAGMLTFSKSTCTFEMKANTGDYFPIDNNQNYSFINEKRIYSRSQEISTLGGSPSNNVRITLGTTSSYQSPVIDMGRTHSIYVRNVVNNNTRNEINTSGGALRNKYISKTVTLADGQDAEDIKVILTGYRPPDTEIYVYGKFRQGEDVEPISSKPWVQLVYADDTRRSSLADPGDFIEYQIGLPRTPYDRLKLIDIQGGNTISIGDTISSNNYNGAVIAVEGSVYTVNITGYSANSISGGWANVIRSNGFYFTANISSVGKTAYANNGGYITYTTDNGTTFTGYKQFAIKIGLSANNPAIVPKAADFRTIALQA